MPRISAIAIATSHWRCPLRRTSDAHWTCDGALVSGRSAPLRLAVDLGAATTHASLATGAARFALDRNSASPDDTQLDLTRVPLVWAQALLSQAWAAGQLKAGTLDGHLVVHAPTDRPLQVTGSLAVDGAAFETPDATLAGEQLGGRFGIDYRKAARPDDDDARRRVAGRRIPRRQCLRRIADFRRSTCASRRNSDAARDGNCR